MAGPWFVDPDNGLTTNNGLSEATPWKLIPGTTGASAQTGYAVVAGDTVNVKNGSTCNLRLIPPAANMTYRGYGVASNVLELTLPQRRDPTKTRQVRVSREPGVHEGMWRLAGFPESNNALAFGNLSGVVIEDVHIVCTSTNTNGGVSMATSSATTATGCVMRRFKIEDSGGVGLAAYSLNVLIEYGQIINCKNDCINIGSTLANTYRLGSTDTVRYMDLRNPSAFGGTLGDLFQTEGPSNDRWEGRLVMNDIYGLKDTAVKQAMVFNDALSGFSLKRFHLACTSADGLNQIALSALRGAVTISDGYVTGGLSSNPLFRARVGTTVTSQMGTGSSFTARNIVADSPSFAGFWDAAQTGTVDGAVVLDNCTVLGANTSVLSYAATVAASTVETYGANFSLKVRNCVLGLTGCPGVRMPAGSAGSVKWEFKNNAFPTGTTFFIGATSYSTLAAWQAAHAVATGNSEHASLTASRPSRGSALLGAGTHIAYRRDINGIQRPTPPAIGAYDTATMRVT